MPSPWRRNVQLLFTELENLFFSEFGLITPFRYDDINPGERYGMISFEQWDIDRNLQATETFKTVTGSFIICSGYSTEQEAKIDPLQLMFDLDNFGGVVQEELSESFGLLYQFKLDDFSPLQRSLRQPIRNPDVWISDVTGSCVARIAIDHFASGKQKFP
jgi:hypothetical protein